MSFIQLEPGLVDETIRYLDTLCIASGAVISDQKFDYWLTGPDEARDWFDWCWRMLKFQAWENDFLMISSKNYLLNFKQKIQTID
jgi:hypothetical protein